MKNFLLTLAFFLCLYQFGYSQPQSNNFETINNLEVIIDPANDSLWQIGEPAKNFFDKAWSVPNAIVTDSLNSYPIGQSRWFELELNQNTTWSWPYIQIEWFYKADMEEGVDGGIIETSYDDGQSWKNIFSDPDFRPTLVGDYNIDTLFNGQIGITGTTDWSWMAICWGTYEGELPDYPNNIKIRYTFVSDSTDTQQEGWMLDNFLSIVEIIGSTSDETPESFLIYPNPTTDDLYFDLSELNQNEASLYIYNDKGLLVGREEFNGLSVETSFISTAHLPSGKYTALLKSGDSVFRSSFMKME